MSGDVPVAERVEYRSAALRRPLAAYELSPRGCVDVPVPQDAVYGLLDGPYVAFFGEPVRSVHATFSVPESWKGGVHRFNPCARYS